MGTEHWGMEVIEGPLVTLEEAKRRVEVEKVCLRTWRESSERKARELEESAKRRETLEAELRTLREGREKTRAAAEAYESNPLDNRDDPESWQLIWNLLEAAKEPDADAR